MKPVHIVCFGPAGIVVPLSATLTLDDASVYAATIAAPQIHVDLPDWVVYGWGANLAVTAPGFKTGPYRVTLAPDINVLLEHVVTAPILPTIVGDHFELNGNRWVWRMTDGFLDVYRLMLGQEQAVRDLHAQAQDLDSRGRRKFLMAKNIPEAIGLPAFDPRQDSGRFFAALNKSLELDAEYGQPSNYVVFADAQLFGMPLGWCQEFWAECCSVLNGKAFITLVNQWNHAGNLVGQPNDYPNPGGLASQGSANEDTNPPNPTDRTGNGYQIWEWCSSVTPTKLSHEYFIWKGLSTGRVLPCVISEPGHRLEEGAVDLDEVRTLTHASMANGCGLTIHSTPGKYSEPLGPNLVQAVRLSMSLLANGQA